MWNRDTVRRRVDTAMDRSVAIGYSRIGYLVRRRWWQTEPERDLTGATVLITGGTSGIGLAAAVECARRGASVHVLGHTHDRAAAAVRTLEAKAPGGSFVPEIVDMSSLADVRSFGEEFAARVDAVDAVVHNAGTFTRAREETAEGHERTLATHVLGPHLLTSMLARSLAASGDGRVVFMSSGGMYAQPLRVDDPEFRSGRFSGYSSYARTKRMQVSLASLWSEVFAGRPVWVTSMHPGWVDTPGVRRHLRVFRALTRPVIRAPEEGADTLVWLLTRPAPDGPGGGLWHDRGRRPTAYRRTKQPTVEQELDLWRYCEEAVAPVLAGRRGDRLSPTEVRD